MAACPPCTVAPRAAARLRRRCSPGPICRSWRAPKAATRACSSSCCAARSTGWRRWRRSAIPDWIKLRGDKALTLDGKTPALPLDSFFALNPAMPNLHRLYQAGQATIVHAAATPYRERSHFDGQDVLESGLGKPGRVDTGWLNRALAALEPARSRPNANAPRIRGRTGDAAGGARPGAGRRRGRRRGCRRRATTPSMRLLDLYRHTDPTLARALEERIGSRRHRARRRHGARRRSRTGTRAQAAGIAQVRAYFAEAAGAAAKFLAQRRRPARRRARVRRLGHARQRRRGQRPARDPARRARRRDRGDRDQHGRGLARDRGRRSSPNSAAPRASTAPTAPITAPPPSRCWSAARSRAGA